MVLLGTLAIVSCVNSITITGEESKALLPVKPNPIESLSETPTPQEIKLAVVFLADNMDLSRADYSKFYNTINCESGFRYDPPGWNDGGLAYGVAQFHRETFKNNCRGNYYSARDQLVCFAEMVAKKLTWNWTCWK